MLRIPLPDSLFRNPYFDWRRTCSSRGEADGLLSRGQVRAVLIIPRGYAEALDRGQTAEIQALVDGSDATSASTAVGYLDALADRMTAKVRLEAFSRQGLSTNLPMVLPEPRVWFNPEMKSSHFLVPGLVAMVLMLSAVVATSLSIVREKERQTIEQIRVSPVRSYELILGKTVPYVLICLATMTLILCLGYVLFDIVIKGSLVLLALATLLFLFAALGLGMLISAITNSQQVAFQVAVIVTLLPSFILSGLVFPINNMPVAIQWLTLVVTPRYFVTILRGVILKGAPLAALWPSFVALLVLGVLTNLLAARFTRKAV